MSEVDFSIFGSQGMSVIPDAYQGYATFLANPADPNDNGMSTDYGYVFTTAVSSVEEVAESQVTTTDDGWTPIKEDGETDSPDSQDWSNVTGGYKGSGLLEPNALIPQSNTAVTATPLTEKSTLDQVKEYLTSKDGKGLLSTVAAGGMTVLGGLLQGQGAKQAAETAAQNQKDLFNMKTEADKAAEERLIAAKKVTVNPQTTRRPRITQVSQPAALTPSYRV